MALILDIILILIMLFFVKRGMDKGGTEGILDMFSFAITILLFVIFKNTITNFLLDLPFIQGLSASIQETIYERVNSADILFPIDIGGEIWVTTYLVNILGFFITFLLSKIAVPFLIGTASKIMSLPVLNSINKLLGAVLGLVKGFIFVWVAIAIWFILCEITGNSTFNDAYTLSQDTYIAKYLFNLNDFFKMFV